MKVHQYKLGRLAEGRVVKASHQPELVIPRINIGREVFNWLERVSS
jgi:hypothetical protein